MHISTPAMRNGNSGRWKGLIAEVAFASRAGLLGRQRISAGLSRKWSAIMVFGMCRWCIYLYFYGPLCCGPFFISTGSVIRKRKER